MSVRAASQFPCVLVAEQSPALELSLVAGWEVGAPPTKTFQFSVRTNHNGFGKESILQAHCQRSNLQLHGNVKVQLLQALMNSKKKYAGL